MTDKLHYSWNEYQTDIEDISKYLTSLDRSIHLVSLYRGSLGMGAHLSNAMDVPLSIIKFQTRDGDDKTPTFIHKAKIENDDLIVIVDDIYDTGLTLDKTEEYIKSMMYNDVEKVVLFSNKAMEGYAANASNGKWVAFPWED